MLHLVDFHAALLRRAIDTLGLIAATLEHADALRGCIQLLALLVVLDLLEVGYLGRRRGNGSALGQHVGPLR